MIIRLSRQSLLSIFDRVCVPPNSDGENFSKVVVFEPVVGEKKLSVLFKNIRNRYVFSVEILNSSDIYDMPFSFEFVPFYKLLKAVTEDVITIHFDSNKVYVNTLKGVINFENFKRIVPKVKEEDFWKEKPYPFHLGETKDLLSVFDICQKVSVFSPVPEYKKVVIFGNNAYFWFGSVLIIVSSLKIPDMVIRFSEITSFKKWLKGVDSFKIQTLLDDYMLVGSDGSRYTFPLSRGREVVSVCVSNTKDIIVSLKVNFNVFKDISKIICAVCNDFDTVNILSKCSSVFMESSTKTGRMASYVLVSDNDRLFSEYSIKITTSYLSKLISIFSSCDEDVVIGVDSRGVSYFICSNIVVSFGVVNNA